MNEFKTILKTSNTYLKAHMGFYILWQFILLVLLITVLIGSSILLKQLKDITMIFGI